MLFFTFEFFFFFVLVLALNWYLKRWPLAWRLFLLIVSYYFYSVWSVSFLLILFLVSLANFFSGKAIHKFVGKRKFVLSLVVIANLLVLGVFKYYDFFRTSLESFFDKIGMPFTIPFLEILLPLGLSFYIFRAISYNVDIYSGKIKPASSWLDFFIYIAFFPHFLAGPIMRAANFFPQLKNGGAKKIDQPYHYFTLLFLGLFKKVVISSYLSLNIVDNVFAVPESHSLLALLLAVFAYSLVIYFDFSGYSDMAIGLAGLMGFISPINFAFPYLAFNLKEFWNRWHVSLSTWARDYIYIPLGGNRKGKIRQGLNLITVMTLIGFWHGAAWHFIFWGFLHGIGLVLTHLYVNLVKGVNLKFLAFIGWLTTFVFVSFSWVFFRMGSMEQSFNFFRVMFDPEKYVEPLQLYVFFFLALGFLLFFYEQRLIAWLVSAQKELSFPLLTILASLAIILLLKLSSDTVPAFIYFSF